ncbi:MAG: tetratricopeptide repeat protein [Asticcacaulis sp.]
MNRAVLFFWVMVGCVAFPAAAELVPPAPPTPEQVFANLNAKAEAGDAQAQFELGTAYADGAYAQKKNAEKAAEWMGRAAKTGYAEAQFKLGEFYRNGYGLKADNEQALIWYEKAADQGQTKASPFVCRAYTQDMSLAPDWARAFSYCKMAAETSDAHALYALGMAYEKGWGAPIDPELALKNLRLAADKGNGAALYALGLIYQAGDGVPKDLTEAFHLFKKSAHTGYRPAILSLAQSYEKGLGVDANMAYAARLYGILARDPDDKAAQDWLKAHDDLAKNIDILKLNQLPRDVIFYATETSDPRFQTMDIHGYFDVLSAASYPADAQNDRVGGTAQAECRFTPEGNLDDCVLIQESPADYGFGSALMAVMERLSNSGNKTDWAKRFAGKTLRISLKWKP